MNIGRVNGLHGLFEKHMKQIRIIGQMDNKIDHTFESANRVYDGKKSCPTIHTCGGGNLQPKTIRRWIKKNA